MSRSQRAGLQVSASVNTNVYYVDSVHLFVLGLELILNHEKMAFSLTFFFFFFNRVKSHIASNIYNQIYN